MKTNSLILLLCLVSVFACTPTGRSHSRASLSEPEQEIEFIGIDEQQPDYTPHYTYAGDSVTPPRNEVEPIESSSMGKWFYGGGLGRSMLNVGTIVVFPPYAVYLLGNAGLTLAGYDPLYITSALPDSAKTPVLEVYDGVTSVPGRLTAVVA